MFQRAEMVMELSPVKLLTTSVIEPAKDGLIQLLTETQTLVVKL